jgi:sirohydrochlorin cobaltochelatase
LPAHRVAHCRSVAVAASTPKPANGDDSLPPAGVLLIAHGSRDAGWSAPFDALRDMLAARSVVVELAFLERMQPDLAGAAAALVDRGCARAVVVPVFLGQGGHVREELPRLVADAMRRHPGIELALAPPVGENRDVIEAIARVCVTLRENF